MPAHSAHRLVLHMKSVIGCCGGLSISFFMLTARFVHVLVDLLLSPKHAHEAIHPAAPFVVALLCDFKSTADRLQLDEVDAREAVRGPRHDAVRHAAPAGRCELLSHSAGSFNLLDEVALYVLLLDRA